MRIDKEKWEAAQVAELKHWRQDRKEYDETDPEIRRLSATYASCLIWGRFGYFPTAFIGKRVIDVGCGPTARCSCFVGAELIGIDPLARDYSNLPGDRMASYRELLAYPAEDNIDQLNSTADAVVSLNCLDDCRDAQAVIENMARYLKPGGIGLLSTDVDMQNGDVDPLHPLRLPPNAIAAILEVSGVEVTLHEQGRSYPRVIEGGRIAWQDGWCSREYVAHHWHFRKAG